MGATTAKVALMSREARVLRLFPFESVSVASFLACWSSDSSRVAISLGSTVVLWSIMDSRFALARFDFTPSSLAMTDVALVVRRSTYRVNARGKGSYSDGPSGAVFSLARLRWNGAKALVRLDKLSDGMPTRSAAKLPPEHG